MSGIHIAALSPGDVEVGIRRADEAEMDEMGSYVQRKKEPRWLWHAIDHRSGQLLAYVFGRRKDEVFLKLKAILEPFGITRYYTDYWRAYTRHHTYSSSCVADIVIISLHGHAGYVAIPPGEPAR